MAVMSCVYIVLGNDVCVRLGLGLAVSERVTFTRPSYGTISRHHSSFFYNGGCQHHAPPLLSFSISKVLHSVPTRSRLEPNNRRTRVLSATGHVAIHAYDGEGTVEMELPIACWCFLTCLILCLRTTHVEAKMDSLPAPSQREPSTAFADTWFSTSHQSISARLHCDQGQFRSSSSQCRVQELIFDVVMTSGVRLRPGWMSWTAMEYALGL